MNHLFRQHQSIQREPVVETGKKKEWSNRIPKSENQGYDPDPVR